MKGIIAVIVLLLLTFPSASFATALTQQQSASLIAVVQSSPGVPASAFVSLITAFSNITVTQASSLITVVQSAPGVPASAFVNLLTSFTVDSITTTQAPEINPQTTQSTVLSITVGQITKTLDSLHMEWDTNIPTDSKIFLVQDGTTKIIQSASGKSTHHIVDTTNLLQNIQYSVTIEAITGTQVQKKYLTFTTEPQKLVAEAAGQVSPTDLQPTIKFVSDGGITIKRLVFLNDESYCNSLGNSFVSLAIGGVDAYKQSDNRFIVDYSGNGLPYSGILRLSYGHNMQKSAACINQGARLTLLSSESIVTGKDGQKLSFQDVTVSEFKQTIQIVPNVITATRNTNFADQTISAGTNNVKIGSFLLSQDVGVNVSSIFLDFVGSANVTKLMLKDSLTGSLLSSAVRFTPTTSVDNGFSVSFPIQSWETRTIDIYGDIPSGVTGTIQATLSTKTESSGISSGNHIYLATAVPLQVITISP